MKAESGNGQRRCPACGALYARAEAACPFCGYIHEAGAEKRFMRKLEDTRLALDRVDDQAREAYLDELRLSSRRILKRVLIAGGILAAVIIFFAAMDHYTFRDDRDYSQEMVWQHEHFPEFDALYEEGSYDELAERLYEYGADGHDVWDWEHYEEITEMQPS